nr:esterase [Bacteroidales bacterium]
MNRILSILSAAFLLACCGGNTQVGVLTKPTPATTNLPGHDYPMVNPDLSVVFRVDMPDAQAVSVNVGGKNYDMVKGEDGIWEVT